MHKMSAVVKRSRKLSKWNLYVKSRYHKLSGSFGNRIKKIHKQWVAAGKGECKSPKKIKRSKKKGSKKKKSKSRSCRRS